MQEMLLKSFFTSLWMALEKDFDANAARSIGAALLYSEVAKDKALAALCTEVIRRREAGLEYKDGLYDALQMAADSSGDFSDWNPNLEVLLDKVRGDAGDQAPDVGA